MRDLMFLALGAFLGFSGSMIGHVAAHLESSPCVLKERFPDCDCPADVPRGSKIRLSDGSTHTYSNAVEPCRCELEYANPLIEYLESNSIEYAWEWNG